jgi:hypothetical protein
MAKTENETKIESMMRQHMGHIITINANWTFSVTGPEFDDERYSITFKSLEAAQKEIDARREQTIRVNAASVTLKTLALDENGERIEITRINRTSGKILPDGQYLYPYVPWVLDALARCKVLRAEIKELSNNLYEVAVTNGRTYGRIDADRYPDVVTKTQQAFTEAKTKAEEIQQRLHAVTETKPEVA